MNNSFLVPANAKRGRLILNIFRPFDLILFCSGVGFSVITLSIGENFTSSIWFVILALLPGCICALLVIPIPNYHNILCTLIAIYDFYTFQRKYEWKGWCFYEQYKKSESGK